MKTEHLAKDVFIAINVVNQKKLLFAPVDENLKDIAEAIQTEKWKVI